MTTHSVQKAAPVRFVELVRVSSQGQAARDTPEDQRAALDRLRASRPGVLVERIDSAVSGAKDSDDRTDVQRLATLARARAFDEVRVRHTDRLTRHDDPRERFAIYGIIADAGAVIVDATGRVIDPRSELGEMTWYFETLMASKERRRILERTMAAKRRLAAEGRLAPQSLPFARTFDKRTGKWGYEQAQIKLYRRLFDLVLRGRTLRQIVAILNDEGVVTPRGRAWTAGTVYNLLRQKHAIGRYVTYGSVIEIPPVVDAATQSAVLARLRANDIASGRHGVKPALLRKLLLCGVCGSPMYTDSRGDGGLYYYCRNRQKSCRKNHRTDIVDEVVRAKVDAWLRRPGSLLAAAERDDSRDKETARWDAADARRELRRLDREEANLARLTRRGLLSARVGESQLAEVARLRAAAERRAEDAQARIEAATRRSELAADVERRIAAVRSGLDGAGFAEWHDLMKILFDRAQGYAVLLWPTGKIELRGALPLDDVGEAALRAEAGGNLSTASRTS